MTATVTPIRPSTNGHRRPIVLEVPQAELVEELMDMQTLAREGMHAVGDALEAIDHLYEALQGTSPRIKAIEHAVVEIHERQEELFNRATLLAGRYESTPRRAGN